MSDIELKEHVSLRSLRLQLWLNLTAYLVAFVATVSIAIHIERGYAQDMDFQFVQCNVVATFVVTAIFAFSMRAQRHVRCAPAPLGARAGRVRNGAARPTDDSAATH